VGPEGVEVFSGGALWVMNKWIGLRFSDGEARLFILCYIKFILSHKWSQLHSGSHGLRSGWGWGSCAAEQGGADNGTPHNKGEDNEILYTEGGAFLA
jgi:hypothetical protein